MTKTIEEVVKDAHRGLTHFHISADFTERFNEKQRQSLEDALSAINALQDALNRVEAKR